MYYETDIEYKAERNAIKILRLFDTIPYTLMEQFLVQKNPHHEYKEKETLGTLLSKRLVSYSPTDKCYRLIKQLPKNSDKICALAAYLHFARSSEVKIHYADYPYDYVFEDNRKLYLLINYSTDGIYKLNFRRNMRKEEKDDYPVIPIIMTINSNANPFANVESTGNMSIIPPEDYYIVNVSYTPGQNMPDNVSVTAKKYKGGTLDEY